MIVIEGKAGKSRILETHVNDLVKRVQDVGDIQIIDYVGVPHIFSGRLKYCSNGEDMQSKDFPQHFRKDYGSFQYVKHLVLELNAPRSIIKDLKVIELEFNKDIIVTIQNNELDEIKVYEI